MADQAPFDQIGAVVDWRAGGIFKGGGYEEEVRTDTDYRGVRVESGDYGVVVHLLSSPFYEVSKGLGNEDVMNRECGNESFIASYISW